MLKRIKALYIRLFKQNHVESFDKIINTERVNELKNLINSNNLLNNEPPIEIKKILSHFDLKYASNDLSIMIHLPSPLLSPGGYSVFMNIYETLIFMGVKAELLNWEDNFETKFTDFKPTVFISSDDENYRERINWMFIKNYKKNHKIKIGLTASIEEYGNTPLTKRIYWGIENEIDFYFSFRAKEYTDTRKEYQPFFKSGFKICNIEFGANLLKFYPVNNSNKKLDYIFFGSTNFAKQKRYSDYFIPILRSKFIGLIWGLGWPWAKTDILLENQKYFYSKSKIALNLHLNEQIEWPCELNERTYILAACKVPQLLDNPALLKYRFSEDSYFSATSPKEYLQLMNYMIQNEEKVKSRTDKMYEEVINKHTTFHRMENFISFLNKLDDK
jgi:hypothetical protein